MIAERFQLTPTRLILAWLAMGLSGCHKTAAPPAPAPPAVTVSHPLAREVEDWDSYTGYLSSPQTANVAARVSGLIISSPFHEGAMVREGQTLFTIDPRPFQADVDNKQAAVAQAEAQEYQARVHFQRFEKLKGTQAISEDDYVSAKAAAEVAQAAVAAAKAALEVSQLNLQWSHVTAPISGRISRIDVTVGNLVNGGSGQATPLTSIVSIDPLYCYVPVPEDAYLKYRTLLNLEQHEGNPAAQVACYLDLPGRASIAGHIDFIDNSVQSSTGTIQVRGVFQNPGWLIPGLFASMRIPQGPPHRALLIPQTAMVVEQNARSILVVGSDDMVQNKNVTFGRSYGPLQAVLSGLRANEQVVVQGVERATPGSKVSPKLAPIPAADLQALESPGEVSPGAATQPAITASSDPGPATQQSDPQR